jgi:hypothetical protein
MIGVLGLLRLRQAEIAGRHHLDAERRHQLHHLLELALVVAGDHQLLLAEAARATRSALAISRQGFLSFHKVGKTSSGTNPCAA